MLGKVWQEVTTVITAKHAFRRAGIFTLDINNIDATKLAPADVAVAQPAIDPQPVLIAPQLFVAQALPACVIQPRLHIDNPVTDHWSDTPLVRHTIGPTHHWSDTLLVRHTIGPTHQWSDTPLVRQTLEDHKYQNLTKMTLNFF